MSDQPLLDGVTDDELVARIGERDGGALSALFRRRQADVYRVAMLMTGSPAAAEDVTQDVFLTVMHDAVRFESGRASVTAWLCGNCTQSCPAEIGTRSADAAAARTAGTADPGDSGSYRSTARDVERRADRDVASRDPDASGALSRGRGSLRSPGPELRGCSYRAGVLDWDRTVSSASRSRAVERKDAGARECSGNRGGEKDFEVSRMTGDEYLRTAKALARETGMADPSVRRIEEELLSAMSSGAADDASALARSAMARPPGTLALAVRWKDMAGRGSSSHPDCRKHRVVESEPGTVEPPTIRTCGSRRAYIRRRSQCSQLRKRPSLRTEGSTTITRSSSRP